LVGHFLNRRFFRPGRHQKRAKLLQVFSIIRRCMRRSVLNRPQILQKSFNRVLHRASHSNYRHTSRQSFSSLKQLFLVLYQPVVAVGMAFNPGGSGAKPPRGFPRGLHFSRAVARRCPSLLACQSLYTFAVTGVSSVDAAAGFSSGASFSQSHPSFMHASTVPIFVFFSTTNGAPHFGHGSAIGM